MPGRLHYRRMWHPTMDPERFVFLDETGAATNMIRRHGWRPRRERLVDAAPPTGAPPLSSQGHAAPASSHRCAGRSRGR